MIFWCLANLGLLFGQTELAGQFHALHVTACEVGMGSLFCNPAMYWG